MAYRLSEQGSLVEARAAVSRIPIVEERAVLLAQFALRALERSDRAAAVQLLSEARALLGERSANYQQLRTQLQIARGYAKIDSGKSASIIETTIELVRPKLVLLIGGLPRRGKPGSATHSADRQHTLRIGNTLLGQHPVG